MPRRPSPLPPSLPYAVFTAAEAREAGVSADRLRAKDLHRIGYGIYARADVKITERDLLTAMTRSGPQIVARGLSAARHWSFPLPWTVQKWVGSPQITPVHLTSGGLVHRDTKLLRWNRQHLRDEEIVTDSGLRITNRVRTWLDLAQELSLDDLVRIGDHLVRMPRPWAEHRHDPFATPAELVTAIANYPGPGRPQLRTALELTRVGSDSAAETTLRLAAGRAQLPAPELNVRQYAGTVDLGEPDLAWPEWKVCIEHDGPSHRTSEQQEKDIRRRERREAHGWIEVQTVAADLRYGCRRGVQRMIEALEKHGWRPPAVPATRPAAAVSATRPAASDTRGAPPQQLSAPGSTPIIAPSRTPASGAKWGK